MHHLRMISLVLLMGCRGSYDTWDGFLEEYTHTRCLVYKECYRAHYEGEYENYATCKEELKASQNKEAEEEYLGCTFSVESAEKCLEKMSTSTCGEHWDDQASIFQACHEDIWICSSE